MKRILYTLLFLNFTSISAQNKRIFFYGNLYDKVGAVVNAHIINLNTKQGTYSNENGGFRMFARENDSLQISSISYKTKIFIVKTTHFGIKENNIELKKENYELDEVEVGKNNLIGNIYSDSKLIKSKKEINAESLNLPYAGSRILTPAERKLQTARGGSTPLILGLANTVSLDLILNSISGRIKKLKKLKEIETTETRTTDIENRFALHIEKEFLIKKEDLSRFINFCEADNEFNTIYNSGEIEIIQFLQKKSKEFKKLNPDNYQY